MRSKYASDKLSFSPYSKVNAFLHIAIFLFFAQRNPYIMLIHTIHRKRKMISENIITDTVKRTCRNFNSFIFQQFLIFRNDNNEYLQVLVARRRFCQLQIDFPLMASLYIYKLKIKAKLQEKTLARWGMSIHHVSTVNCVNLRSQSFVFKFLNSCRGWFKATIKSSLRMPWNYQNKLIQAPIVKIQVMRDFFEQANYILIMMYSLV